MEPSFDLYLFLHPFSELAAGFKRAVRPLLPDLERRHLVGIEGYYLDESDAALVNLRFQRGFARLLGPGRLRELISEWGLPVIAPEELSRSEQDQFFLGHLASYTTYVQLYPSDSEPAPLLERVLDRLAEHAVAAPPATGAFPMAWIESSRRRPPTVEQ